MAIFRITRSGLEHIKKFEALKLRPYKDIAGKWTIGWGHLIKANETHLLRPQGITSPQATELLKHDLQIAEKAINNLVVAPLTGNQYDALVSFVFNIGVGAFANSTMLRKLNDQDYEGASLEFPRWRWAGGKESAGLLARRAMEQSTFIL